VRRAIALFRERRLTSRLERLSNQPEDVHGDVYSLGATLFHAAAGKPPIDSSTNSATELRELKQHPSNLRAIAPEVSAQTSYVLQRMIAPEPAQRFSSYDDLLAEFEAAQRAREIADAAGRSPRWPFARLCRRSSRVTVS
jgi:serine/threonine protein kinase